MVHQPLVSIPGSGRRGGEAGLQDPLQRKARDRQAVQALIDYLEPKGVDVSQLRTAVKNNDGAAISAWFERSYQAHVSSLSRNKVLVQNPANSRNTRGFIIE